MSVRLESTCAQVIHSASFKPFAENVVYKSAKKKRLYPIKMHLTSLLVTLLLNQNYAFTSLNFDNDITWAHRMPLWWTVTFGLLG